MNLRMFHINRNKRIKNKFVRKKKTHKLKTNIKTTEVKFAFEVLQFFFRWTTVFLILYSGDLFFAVKLGLLHGSSFGLVNLLPSCVTILAQPAEGQRFITGFLDDEGAALINNSNRTADSTINYDSISRNTRIDGSNLQIPETELPPRRYYRPVGDEEVATLDESLGSSNENSNSRSGNSARPTVIPPSYCWAWGPKFICAGAIVRFLSHYFSSGN